MSSIKLREVEKTKIECARKFFAEISEKITEDKVNESVSMSFTLVMGAGGIDRNGLFWTIPLVPDVEPDGPQTLVVLGRDFLPVAEYVLPDDVGGFRIYDDRDDRLILLDWEGSRIHLCAYPDGLADSGS